MTITDCSRALLRPNSAWNNGIMFSCRGAVEWSRGCYSGNKQTKTSANWQQQITTSFLMRCYCERAHVFKMKNTQCCSHSYFLIDTTWLHEGIQQVGLEFSVWIFLKYNICSCSLNLWYLPDSQLTSLKYYLLWSLGLAWHNGNNDPFQYR